MDERLRRLTTAAFDIGGKEDSGSGFGWNKAAAQVVGSDDELAREVRRVGAEPVVAAAGGGG